MANHSPQTEIAVLELKVENLTHEVTELKDQVKSLVEAWQTANGLVKFVKWAAGLASAGVILFNVFHMKPH